MKTEHCSSQRSQRGLGSQDRIADCELLSAETRLDPRLMVIGLNHRTAAAAVRERFWISESRPVRGFLATKLFASARV